ncbi:hypothetical protein B0H66DRAFT_546721 [Apodospora peruviana]|uniref:Uncharacterized protein n=1 Tax=Apodospora peruviana TaxID=516989 RepID=A0AAE0MGB9_9PEZI|nr:hypothetical protein B0H66DRAFT_571401 [Apodospora peruviana]KAK3331517.1 hypothetical protein B0H66DRAFT_546721 [Apodospora peruviana]
MKLAILVLSIVIQITVALPSRQEPTRRTTGKGLTDQILYSISLADFEKRGVMLRILRTLIGRQTAAHMPRTTRLGFPFLSACHRHDFGYRNLKAQNRFTETTKKEPSTQILKTTCSGSAML